MNQPIHSNWHILFLKHMVLWHPSLHQPSGSWAVFQCSGLTFLAHFHNIWWWMRMTSRPTSQERTSRRRSLILTNWQMSLFPSTAYCFIHWSRRNKSWTRLTLSFITYDLLHGNGYYSLCRATDGEHRCRQMLYCLHTPIQWRRGPSSKIIKNWKQRMKKDPQKHQKNYSMNGNAEMQ